MRLRFPFSFWIHAAYNHVVYATTVEHVLWSISWELQPVHKKKSQEVTKGKRIFFVQEQQGAFTWLVVFESKKKNQKKKKKKRMSQEINVQTSDTMQDCVGKCSYQHDYRESNSLAISNDQFFASAKYSPGSKAYFNGIEYAVTDLRLYAPSIHKFDGKKADAELVVLHVAREGSGTFNVGVPIVKQSSSSFATDLLAALVDAIRNKAPSQGAQATTIISNFNVADLVPNTPYYSYKDGTTDWVVYGLPDALMLSETSMNNLKSVIKPYTIPATGGTLFRNPNGPSFGDADIYITCQPENRPEDEEEKVAVEYATTTQAVDNSKLLENPTTGFFIKLMISCFVFVCVFLGVAYMYNIVFNPKKNPVTEVIQQTAEAVQNATA